MCNTDPRSPEYGKLPTPKEGVEATTTQESAKPNYEIPEWKAE